MSDAYYFGCLQDAGHFLWDANLRGARGEDLPFRYEVLDGGLLPPRGGQREGYAALWHGPGWTILTFWDRSVDGRPGSNSAFILKGRLGFDDAVGCAKTLFPSVWKRFAFEVSQCPASSSAPSDS